MIEILPVLFIVLLLVLGTLQVSLFMSGQHAAELGAYRASRVLEQRNPNTGNRRASTKPAEMAARGEAERWCWVGYPRYVNAPGSPNRRSHASVKVQSFPARNPRNPDPANDNRVRADMTMTAFLPLVNFISRRGERSSLGPLRVHGDYPLPLQNVSKWRSVP